MDNKKLRYALILFICASIIAISAALYMKAKGKGGTKGGGADTHYIAGDNAADEVIRDVVYTTIGGEGKGSWTLKALTGRRLGEVLVLDDVDLVYTTAKDGEGKYTITGKSGSFDESLGMVDLKGGVRVVSAGGETLNTTHLQYLVSKRAVTTEEPVSFTLSDGISVEGEGFEMDFESGEFTVKRDVKTVIRDEAI